MESREIAPEAQSFGTGVRRAAPAVKAQPEETAGELDEAFEAQILRLDRRAAELLLRRAGL